MQKYAVGGECEYFEEKYKQDEQSFVTILEEASSSLIGREEETADDHHPP
jgi:hypothetical protein